MKTACLQMLLWALCLVVTLAGGQPRAHVRCSNMCVEVSKKFIPERLIRRYYELDSTCRQNAACKCCPECTIFVTMKDKEICVDSNESWVKEIKDKLKRKDATVMPPRDVTSAEEPGSIERHVGLPELPPSQATAPAGFFQGAGTTLRERVHAPAATTEVPSKPPPGRQEPPQLPAGSSPVTQEEAVHPGVTPEAKGEPSSSPASSATVAAGLGSRQPSPRPTGQHTASPKSNSDLMAAARGSIQPVLATNGSLDPTGARANTPDTASSSSGSDLPSNWDSMRTTTVTETAPQTTSVSTLSSTTATDKAASVHTNRAVGPSAGTTALAHSLPVGKQEPSNTGVFTHQALSSQARVQMITVKPNNLPLPTFLSKSQMHFVTPVSVVCGLMVSSVALVWLYLKFGVKPEETSREMVQGLLYQQAGHQDNVYPMEVI
ncbi:mucin-1-like isoform X1 [Agelaius tricolor]|uniref:mucin-1-like isoform X1 n=1 Tax=Agelaius tricolor TaxID=9191 RepID=UPI0039F1B92A